MQRPNWYLHQTVKRMLHHPAVLMRVVLLMTICSMILLFAAQLTGPKTTYDAFRADSYLFVRMKEPAAASLILDKVGAADAVVPVRGMQLHVLADMGRTVRLVGLDDGQFIQPALGTVRPRRLEKPGFLADRALLPDGRRVTLDAFSVQIGEESFSYMGFAPMLVYRPHESALEGMEPAVQVTGGLRAATPGKAVYLRAQDMARLALPVQVACLQFERPLSAEEKARAMALFAPLEAEEVPNPDLQRWGEGLTQAEQADQLLVVPILALLATCLLLQMISFRLWVMDLREYLRVWHLMGYAYCVQRRLIWLLLLIGGLVACGAGLALYRLVSALFMERYLQARWSTAGSVLAAFAFLLVYALYSHACVSRAIAAADAWGGKE